MAKDQAFWDRVDNELRENEHIMLTRVKRKRSFNLNNSVKRTEASDNELREAYADYKKTH